MSRELNILFNADLWSVLGDVRAILYQVRNPSLPAACALRNTDGGDRWSLLTPWFEDPSPERCAELVRHCAGDPALDVRIVAVGEWERATLLAERFRRSRVFLVGDAAPGHPGGRLRDEHCDPERSQPGLEAGRGAAGLGRDQPARQL